MKYILTIVITLTIIFSHVVTTNAATYGRSLIATSTMVGAPVMFSPQWSSAPMWANHFVSTSTTATSTFAGSVQITGTLGLLTATPNLAVVIGDTLPERNGFAADWGQYSLNLQSYRQDYTQKASGQYSTVIGTRNTASGGSAIAIGTTNTSAGSGSTAIGTSNTSPGTDSSAIGHDNTSSGIISTAVGYNNTASNFATFASGVGNIASGNQSSAYGNTNTASGEYSVVIGNNTVNSVASSVMIGSYDDINTRYGNILLAPLGGNVGIGTTSPGTLLSLGNTGSNTVNISATATSTFGSGINLRTGCYAVNGTCIGGGSSTGASTTLLVDNNTWSGSNDFINANVVENPADPGQAVLDIGTKFRMISDESGLGTLVFSRTDGPSDIFQYINSTDTFWVQEKALITEGITLTGGQEGKAIQSTGGTATFSEGSKIGVGTTSPFALLSVQANHSDATIPYVPTLFAISSSTPTATSTHMTVLAGGNVGIGTTSPYAKLSVVGPVVAEYFHATSTATSTFAGSLAVTEVATSSFASGINLAAGCFALNGVCAGTYGNTNVNAYIHASTTIPKTYTANSFSNTQTFTNKVGIGALGNGRLTVDYSNADYTNTSGANAHIHLKNANAGGSTSIYSEINGTPVLKVRSNYLGDLTWVSYATDAARGHYFFVGGDYPTGTAKMKIAPNGTTIGSNVAADSPAQLLKVLGTTAEQFRVAYDSSSYYSTGVSSAGAVTLDAVGSGAKISLMDSVGVGTTSPRGFFDIGGKTLSTIPAPTSPSATVNYDAGNYPAEGFCYQYYIYSYKTIGGSTYYSPTYADTGQVCDDFSYRQADVSVSWTAAAGVTGYKVLVYNDYLGFYYDYSYTLTGTSFTDGLGAENSFVYDSTVTPTSAYVDSADGVYYSTGNNLVTTGTTNIAIGTTTSSEKLSVHSATATSSILINSASSGKGGRIILEDVDGAGCTEVTALNGVLSSKIVTCP